MQTFHAKKTVATKKDFFEVRRATISKKKPPMESLYRKLKDCHQQQIKTGPLLNDTELQAIACKMPRTEEELLAVLPAKATTMQDWILPITQAHKRDQALFNDCVSEIRAFVHGGGYAWQLLKGVYNNILAEYKMESESATVLDACGLYFQPFQNELKRKRVIEEDTPPA